MFHVKHQSSFRACRGMKPSAKRQQTQRAEAAFMLAAREESTLKW